MREDLWSRQYTLSGLVSLPLEKKASFAGEKESFVLSMEQRGRGALLLQLRSGLQRRKKLKVSTEIAELGKGSRRALSSGAVWELGTFCHHGGQCLLLSPKYSGFH